MVVPHRFQVARLHAHYSVDSRYPPVRATSSIVVVGGEPVYQQQAHDVEPVHAHVDVDVVDAVERALPERSRVALRIGWSAWRSSRRREPPCRSRGTAPVPARSAASTSHASKVAAAPRSPCATCATTARGSSKRNLIAHRPPDRGLPARSFWSMLRALTVSCTVAYSGIQDNRAPKAELYREDGSYLIMRITVRGLVASLAVSVLFAAGACSNGAVNSGSNGYPTHTVTMIVPFEAGGSADVAARMWSKYAAKKLGVQVRVVNVAGASGVTGTVQAVNAKPDGYTLLVDAATTSSALYALKNGAPGSISDRTYVARVTSDPYFYFACHGTGWSSLKQALSAAKRDPSGFKWGAGSVASNPMLSQLTLLEAAGVPAAKTRAVVFDEGNAPSLQACASGDVDFAAGSAADVQKYAGSGRITPLATTASKRLKAFPRIPTTAELGLKKANWETWYGVSGPKGLPQAVSAKWASVFRGVQSDPAAETAAKKSGLTWAVMSHKQFTSLVLNEYTNLRPLKSAMAKLTQ